MDTRYVETEPVEPAVRCHLVTKKLNHQVCSEAAETAALQRMLVWRDQHLSFPEVQQPPLLGTCLVACQAEKCQVWAAPTGQLQHPGSSGTESPSPYYLVATSKGN